MFRASMTRPSKLPRAAPTGRVARDLPSDRWIEHPGYGLTPQRVVSIYRLAEAGQPRQQCDLFDDLTENDGHLRNLLDQRRQAVSGKPLVIQADGADPDAMLGATVLSEAIRRLAMVDVIDHQLTFNSYGWAATEIDWDVTRINGRDWIVPVWFANVPARRFLIDQATDALRITTARDAVAGEALAAGKWWITRRSGVRVARAGLMRTAAWLAAWKRFATRDWVIYAERYGNPLALVKYDDSQTSATDDESKDVAYQVAESIGNDSAAVVPSSINVEIHEAGRTGDSSGVHGGLISHCNAEMSKLVNGGTLSNDSAGSSTGGASYALGEVHASRSWDNVQADAERIQESFRICVAAAFMRFNGLSGASPLLKIQVVRDLEPGQRAALADTYVNKLGGRVSLSQLGQELGFKEPSSAEDTAPGEAPTPAKEPAP